MAESTTVHRRASRADWLTERRELLVREKELTRLRDELAARRRELSWVPIEKHYRFDTEAGSRSLVELFEGRSQLLVYHFMFGPDWQEGCPSCSLWADGFDGVAVHLAQRDVSFTCVSRAPLERLLAYRARMGWSFAWASSLGSDFNTDFGVSFGEEERAGTGEYNYAMRENLPEEAPGLSAFALSDGEVFHTYSCYARGLEPFNPAYQLLDLAPRGRDEDGLAWPMAWVRRHDAYASS